MSKEEKELSAVELWKLLFADPDGAIPAIREDIKKVDRRCQKIDRTISELRSMVLEDRERINKLQSKEQKRIISEEAIEEYKKKLEEEEGEEKREEKEKIQEEHDKEIEKLKLWGIIISAGALIFSILIYIISSQ